MQAGAFLAVFVAVLNTVTVLFTVVVFVTGAGVTLTCTVPPLTELVFQTVTVEAGIVLCTVVVESSDCTIVVVLCGAVARIVLLTSLKLVLETSSCVMLDMEVMVFRLV